jgi:glucose-6-phosphate isomerase
MNLIDGFTLDRFGAKSLEQITPQDWEAQLDSNLETLQKQFVQEDKEGYENLVKRLRGWTWSHKTPAKHPDFVSNERIAEIAQEIRAQAKAFITIGIGGSDLGGRTLHDLLNHPYHNEMAVSGQLQGVPEIYFTGDTFDPLRLRALLDLLKSRQILDKTYINIVSKSGTTAETALAGMILADAMGKDWMSRAVATTGLNDKSLLFKMEQKGLGKFMALLPVPDGVGGRFSFASPVGALLLAVTAPGDPLAHLKSAYDGYAAAHDAFLGKPVAANPAYQIAKLLHTAEAYCGKNSMVFYPYFDNRKLGDWFLQLYSESVQERAGGLNVISVTGPTGNHSLLNGVVSGPRDKFVLFLTPNDFCDAMAVPPGAPLEGNMKIFEGKTLAHLQNASLKGTAMDFSFRSVPNATLYFPKRDAASAFALMRILMDMVAVKGRLQSLHLDPLTGERLTGNEDTYIQNGVEGYKQRMRENI